MSAIYRKEMKIYFSTPFGYVIMAILLFFMGLFTVVFNLLSAYADFSYPLVSMHWVLLITVPFLTMRSIAAERHNRTDQLLYSLPIPLGGIVLGKFFAMLTVFLIPTALTALYPLLLSSFGTVSFSAAYVALFGYVLLGGALIALCTYISSLVENQMLAAVLSIAATLVIYLLDSISMLLPTSALGSFILCVLAALCAGALICRSTKNLNVGLFAALALVLPISVIYAINASLFEALASKAMDALALFGRFGELSYGHFSLPATVTYLTFTVFFLFLTVRSMERRRIC